MKSRIKFACTLWAIGLKIEEPFALGGVWERWVSKDKQTVLEGYAIITVEPNEVRRRG